MRVGLGRKPGSPRMGTASIDNAAGRPAANGGRQEDLLSGDVA